MTIMCLRAAWNLTPEPQVPAHRIKSRILEFPYIKSAKVWKITNIRGSQTHSSFPQIFPPSDFL